jgi:hypothetical protein
VSVTDGVSPARLLRYVLPDSTTFGLDPKGENDTDFTEDETSGGTENDC